MVLCTVSFSNSCPPRFLPPLQCHQYPQNATIFFNCCIQNRSRRWGWRNKGQMEDPRGYTGCYNNRQAGYTNCVSGHSKCMVSTAENPPVFSVSHSHARDAPPLLKETVALLSRWRVSWDPLSMKKSLLLSSIHLFPAGRHHQAALAN